MEAIVELTKIENRLGVSAVLLPIALMPIDAVVSRVSEARQVQGQAQGGPGA